MNKKYLFILIIVLLIAGAGFYLWIYSQSQKEEEFKEYIPQEEISDVQERQTLVTLYFVNKETKMLMPEARLIDAKLLTQNPYATLVNLLLNGPKNDKLESIIPKETRLNNVTLEKGVAIVDLSNNFIKGVTVGEEEEHKIVYSIVNTLLELTEIEEVKILIDGEEGLCFEDEQVDFKEPFTKVE